MVLDIIVVLIILLYAFNGWRRGLILSVFSILGYVISLIVARSLSPSLTRYVVLNTGLDNWLDGILSEGIKNITKVQMPTNVVSSFATETLVNVICFFVIFSITSLLIFNIARLINRIERLPVIGELNSVGGLIFGTVKGLLLVFIILSLSEIVISAGNTKLKNTIEETVVVDVMYKNNPISYLVKEVVPREIKKTKFL